MSARRGWVVLAWLEEKPVVTGQRSGRYGPEVVVGAAPWPRAALWCRNGGEEDAAKALKSCDGARVYIYPMTEDDPQGRARADVMRDSGFPPPAERLDLDGLPRR